MTTQINQVEAARAGTETVTGGEPPELDMERNPFSYDLSGDTSGEITKYTSAIEVTGAIELELGVEAFNVSAKVGAKVARKRTVTLEFELPAGLDYEACVLKRPDGVWWTAPPPS